MTLDASGRLGIGITSPSSKLHIESSTFDDFIKLTRTGIGSMGITATNPRGIQTTDAAGNFVGWHVTATGNVGIGTTSPVGFASDDLVLQISNPTGGGSAMRSMMRFTNVNSGTAWGNGTFLGLDSTLDFYIGQLENANLLFQTNSTERMRITSGGNVLVNTTTDNGQKMQIAGGASTALRLDANSGVAALNIGAGATLLVDAPGVGGGRFTITSGGNVGIGLNNPSATLHVNGTIKTGAPSVGSAETWKLGSYAAGGTGTATGVIYIEVNGQIYSIPALLGTP